MSTTLQSKRISELAAVTLAANNAVVPISQGSTMVTYKIGVNDLIRNAPALTAKANQTDLVALQQQYNTLSPTVSGLSSQVIALDARLDALEEEPIEFVSSKTGIKYTKYNGVFIEL